MGMKKKMLVSSLAASFVLSSLPVLPLSSHEWPNKLGIQRAAASDFSELPLPELADKIAGQIKELTKDFTEEERQVIKELRSRLASLDAATAKALVAPIWARLESKADDKVKYPDLTLDNLVWLIQRMAAINDETLIEDLEELHRDPKARKMFNQLSKVAGVPGIGMGDFQQFRKKVYDELEALVRKEIPSLFVAVIEGRFKEEADKLVDQAIEIVVQHKSLKISKLLRELNVTSEDLRKTRKLFSDILDPDNKVQLAVAGVLVRSQIEFVPQTTNNGKTLTPTLRLFGYEINKLPYLSWKVVSDSEIYGKEGRFILPDNVESAKADIAATLEYKNMSMLIYKGTIEMGKGIVNPPNPPKPPEPPKPPRPGGGNGGGGWGPPTPPIHRPDVSKAIESISKVIAGLESAQGSYTRNEARAKARKAVEEAIRAVAVAKLNESLKIENGVAKADYDVEDLRDLLEDVKAIAKEANEQLKKTNPDAGPAKVVFTLDFGELKEVSKAELPIKKELMDLAKEYGIDAIAVRINGLTATFDTDQLQEDTIWKVEKLDRPATAAHQTLVSDVYELSFDAGGKPLTTFSTPVELRFPAFPGNHDQELLTLVKFDQGKTLVKGGMYDPDQQALIVGNKDFSVYGVIENHVSFHDLDEVKQWAGRQVSVIGAKGIVEGREDGQFEPQNFVTRAEFAKMIVKVMGLEDSTAAVSFSDVSDQDWFQPYVAAAVKYGVVNGRSEDKFEPDAYITRAEMAAMASRALMEAKDYQMTPDMDKATELFADAGEVHPTLMPGVSLAAYEGIIIGEENQRLNPNSHSTRAQAAVMIYRLLNK
ncbi:S-layer homology domain-containing protein [Paenibacillus sp. 32O-W]|uniref:S-layer homology domain-containing protein n=1 Tax=Paenibacillus sp. 32O-W TaxID=1695218 RepID=UPI0021B69BEA|nr:S-layer homology domain-containing protein [Paenibacillus sp. 32O-W]